VLADGWAQVWDQLDPVLEKVEWVLPRRRCACCRKVTTAAVAGVRHAAAGNVSYGPRLHGAAVLLASEANVPVERAAMVIDALLGVPVSAGFVARANERLACDLQAAGFDEAMKAALRSEPVLCGDESPVNVLRKDRDEATGTVLSGTPHLLVVRTPTPGLVWYAPPSRLAGSHQRARQPPAPVPMVGRWGTWARRSFPRCPGRRLCRGLDSPTGHREPDPSQQFLPLSTLCRHLHNVDNGSAFVDA
jgi:hypothetical protein